LTNRLPFAQMRRKPIIKLNQYVSGVHWGASNRTLVSPSRTAAQKLR
jgi:hypothetical protein